MARTVAETEEGFAVAVRVTTSGATAAVAVTVAVAVELAAVMATLLDGVAAGKKAVGTVAATGAEGTKEAAMWAGQKVVEGAEAAGRAGAG